jgi:hypothetical protein
MTMLSKYRENDLYQWIKENFIEDLILTKEKHSFYDCYSKKFNLDIELKCRRTHYPDLIIEQKKYLALMSRSKTHDTIPLYINSTPKGIWAFYISDIDIDWKTKMLPKQTDFPNNILIDKTIGYLKLESGINLMDIL